MRLGTADVLVRAKTDKFNKDIDKSEKKVKGFATSSSKSLSGLSKSFVSLAGPAGVAAFTASLGGVIAVGARFEKQMATVRGIARASEKDFKLLSGAAKEMGATTEWSATQAAEALEFMALAGWNVQKSIEGLPLMLNAATAAGENLAETSDILTDTLTAMGLEIEDMGRLTDVMIGTTTRANTNFLQMGEALKEAAPYARAYGFEIEEVAALLGVVADAGIKASDAGTGLKNTWINNAKAAKLLGTDATDLIGTLRAANRAQWDTNQFAKVYGKIAGKTVLNIAAQIDKYEALAETLHGVNDETKELADIKLDTLIGDWDIFKSAVEGTATSIYSGINEPLRISLQTATELVTMIDVAAKYWAEKLAPITASDVTREKIEDVRKEIEKLEGELDNSTGWLNFWKGAGYTEKAESKLKNLQFQLSILQKTLRDFEEEEEKEDKDDKKKPPPVVEPPPPPSPDDSWIKSMQAQESFAIKMAESEQSRLNKRYELEQEINAKIHDELLSDTEFRLQELDKQFLAADGFVKDKAMLDEWYVKQYKEIVGTQKQAYMDLYDNFGILTQEAYDQIYERYVKDRDDFIALTGNKETAHQVFTERLNALNEEMEAGSESWIAGAKAGLESYAESSNDAFANIKELAVSSLQGMEDALVEFAMTGKLNFKQLAASIIKDLIRIAVQAAITNAIMAGFSLFSTPGATPTPMGGTAAGSTAGMTPTTPMMAKGGIFGSGLSSHSNMVVDSPTFFSFAKGQGLMGEAGPEAIMPLTRLPGGDLGVKTETSKATAIPVMTVNIHEAPGTQTRVEQSEDGQSLDVIIEQIEQSMQSRMSRGTGMAPFMDGRYGRAY